MAAAPTARPSPPPELLAEVARQASRPAPGLAPLLAAVRERFGGALDAVLLYGSCLHQGDPTDGIVDLYALVRDYRSAYREPLLGALNRALPPNVFYVEAAEGGATLRAKLAVLSLDDFERGTARWFHPYLWARFAQPCRVLLARDADVRGRVHGSLARAALRFHAEVLPTLAGTGTDAAGLWAHGLALTYASELRPEGEARSRWLVERNLADYEPLTAAAAPALGQLLTPAGAGRYRVRGTPSASRRARLRWRLRRWQGKLLSLLRLAKSALTFAGAADYVAFKIERHTGKPFRVTPFMRRHPLLAAPWALVALLRVRALR